MNVHTRWQEPEKDGVCVAWARDLFQATAPFAAGSAYVNFMPEDEADRIEMAYGRNYPRLAEAKRRWDPDNLFRMNQNIRPASWNGRPPARRPTDRAAPALAGAVPRR